MLAVAASGCLAALLADIHELHRSAPYLTIATALLAIGLYSATFGLDLADISGSVRLVLVAVTFGVVVKAALIASLMYLVFREPAYLVLGVAVAQIDPLSVAVMRRSSRLTERGRAILTVWSSFDDPVTAILVVYLSAVALRLDGPRPDGNLPTMQADAALNALFNVLLVAAAAATWWLLRRITGARTTTPRRWSMWATSVAVVALLGIGVLAVEAYLMLAVAVIGLFFRPAIGALVEVLTPVAFLIAVFMLGMVLADGGNVIPGIVLGLAAFGAQIAVGLLVTRTLPTDRLRLALSQQNGITAIILALLLETVFPGTVAIIGPAILVVGFLHLASNTALDRIERGSPRKALDGRSPDVDTEGVEQPQPDRR